MVQYFFIGAVPSDLRQTAYRQSAFYFIHWLEQANQCAELELERVHQGRPVSQEELMDHVWDNSVDSFSNSIRVHISALRKKLRAVLGYDPIRNRIGEGYLMGGEEV